MKARDAFCLVVKDHGVAALAERMGQSAATLQNKANPRSESHVPTLRDCEDVTVLTGDPRIADAFCQLAGGVFVRVSAFHGVSDAALLDIVTKMGKEFGDVCAELNRDLADGRVDMAEVERFDQQVRELQQVAAEAAARVRSMVTAPRALRVAK